MDEYKKIVGFNEEEEKSENFLQIYKIFAGVSSPQLVVQHATLTPSRDALGNV